MAPVRCRTLLNRLPPRLPSPMHWTEARTSERGCGLSLKRRVLIRGPWVRGPRPAISETDAMLHRRDAMLRLGLAAGGAPTLPQLLAMEQPGRTPANSTRRPPDARPSPAFSSSCGEDSRSRTCGT